MGNRIIKFVVCGFGHIGKKHVDIILKHPQCKLLAIIDIDPEIQTQSEFPEHTRYFKHLEDFLNEEVSADIIILATPNGFHVEQAISSLKKGFHVVIEKPMGLSKASCEQVIKIAQQMDRHIFVVKQNRYSPTVKWLKELIQSKKIGEIFMVSIQCFWNRDQRYYGSALPEHSISENSDKFALMQDRKSLGLHPWKGTSLLDGGVLYTQFSHFIDIMYWIFGDIKNIRSSMYNFNHRHITPFPDSGNITFDFVHEGCGTFQFSTSVFDKNMESSIVVIGSEGSVKIGGQYMNTLEYCHIKDYTTPEIESTNSANDYGPFKGSAANHQFIIANVIDTLNGLATASTGPEDGLKVVEIIDRMYAANSLNQF